MDKRHWLITAFEPFAGRETNNSKSVLDEIKKLEAENSGSPEWRYTFHYEVLPVEYDGCFDHMSATIKTLSQRGITLEGILSLGEGHEEFKLETQANNLDDVAELSDNRGITRSGKRIFEDLPADAAIPLRFPFQAFSRIRTSNNPGYFICNHLCARMARTCEALPGSPVFGFIHVPKTGSGGMFTPDVCAAVIVNGMKKVEP
jgi:pyrrolidone-carboxylate peptidase